MCGTESIRFREQREEREEEGGEGGRGRKTRDEPRTSRRLVLYTCKPICLPSFLSSTSVSRSISSPCSSASPTTKTISLPLSLHEQGQRTYELLTPGTNHKIKERVDPSCSSRRVLRDAEDVECCRQGAESWIERGGVGASGAGGEGGVGFGLSHLVVLWEGRRGRREG